MHACTFASLTYKAEEMFWEGRREGFLLVVGHAIVLVSSVQILG